MNKTIYLRDEEAPVWERARDLAGDKLSPVIVGALKHFIALREAQMAGFERIEISFADSDDSNLPKKKAFYGKWLITPWEPLHVEHIESPVDDYFAVATTAKGSAVFYTWVSDGEAVGLEKFAVYSSLEIAAKVRHLNLAARKAIEILGVPVEELDI